MSTPSEQAGALWLQLMQQLAAQLPATKHDDLARLLHATPDPTQDPDSHNQAPPRPAGEATARFHEADVVLAGNSASWERAGTVALQSDIDELHEQERLNLEIPESRQLPAWLTDTDAYQHEQDRDRDMNAESDRPIAAAPAGVPGAIMIAPIGWKPGWKVEAAGCRVDILPPTDQRATYIVDPCSAFFTPEEARIYARLMLLGVTFIDLIQQDAPHGEQ